MAEQTATIWMPQVGATDVDGDGSLACDGDCDDNDATLYLV